MTEEKKPDMLDAQIEITPRGRRFCVLKRYLYPLPDREADYFMISIYEWVDEDRLSIAFGHAGRPGYKRSNPIMFRKGRFMHVPPDFYEAFALGIADSLPDLRNIVKYINNKKEKKSNKMSGDSPADII